MKKAAKQAKVKKVMGEFKKGSLHSGSKKGPKVQSRKQAIAIAMSQSKQAKMNAAQHKKAVSKGNMS